MRLFFKLLLFTFCVFLVSFSGVSQPSRTNYELTEKMKQAIALMEIEDYTSANTIFRNILATEKVLPNNLSYHFALTLYHIKQYKNSSNFNKKYLNLTGKAGDYYTQSLQLEELLDQAFTEIRQCELCDINGYQLITCTFCQGEKNIIEACSKCRAVGIISCQKCKGEGVVITTDTFGENKYQTCDRCSGKGLHTCDLCEGKKQLNLVCNACLGTGKESSKSICTHGHNH
ncbi:MAG: molecular chaperone DnaJ [Cyclobacteriaceae bacterium]|nr:molecular chaperone DnaJ [Cyclobacteriaceae bacterium]